MWEADLMTTHMSSNWHTKQRKRFCKANENEQKWVWVRLMHMSWHMKRNYSVNRQPGRPALFILIKCPWPTYWKSTLMLLEEMVTSLGVCFCQCNPTQPKSREAVQILHSCKDQTIKGESDFISCLINKMGKNIWQREEHLSDESDEKTSSRFSFQFSNPIDILKTMADLRIEHGSRNFLS